MAEQRLTADQINTLTELANSGQRVEFYLTYFEFTGSEQAIIQAQITSYSGVWGGAALSGNAVAKSLNPDLYNISLDEFSQKIANETLKAILADWNASDGNGGFLSNDQMQAADRAVWAELGLR